MTGGANSLELLWSLLAIAAVAIVAVAAAGAWLALWIESRLAGTTWDVTPLDMPAVLIDLASGESAPVSAAVGQSWRPIAIMAVATLATLWPVLAGVRAWTDWQAGWRHRQRNRERLDSRVWATRQDLAPLLSPAPSSNTEPAAGGRLLIGSFHGRDVLAPARTSVMAIAPTRTGKSTRLVVPNLLRWEGPAVVTSVKRDVYDLTVSRRANFGPVSLFDPTGATSLESVRWSPLLSSTSFPDATKTALWLADAASVVDKQEHAKFWETLATKLLAPLLYAAANKRKTMRDVSHWVDRSAFDQVQEILVDLGDEDSVAAWQAIRGLPIETRGSVFGTAMAIFRAFGSPRVREATSCTPGDVANTLNIAELLKENGTLYLVSPEYEQAELRPVFVALVQAVYRAAVEASANLMGGAPLNPPLLLMLDEAGNIAPLHSLPKIASTGAGQGITLMTIWQDRAQIRELYGDAERTVIANHTTSVWLPGSQDLDTLKLLADLIGDQWVASPTVSTAADGGLSVSEGSERIDVAPPAFLRTLRHGRAVMLTGNLPPALVRTHAYYEQARWCRLIDPNTLRRHAATYDGTGPTTAARWVEMDWPDSLPTGPEKEAADAGALGRVLAASYPEYVECDPDGRDEWGLFAEPVPDRLSTETGRWRRIRIPPPLVELLGGELVADLADPDVRDQVLPILLDAGPAELVAEAVTLPLLAADWDRLPLSDTTQQVWEDCYPVLGGDLTWMQEPPDQALGRSARP